MNVETFLSAASPAAFLSSTLLGLLIGAFYGWYVIGPDHPPVYPVALWLIGVAFIALLVVLALFDRSEPRYPIEFGSARAVLWTATCGAIPMGRLGRHLIEVRILRRKRKALEEQNGTHG